jgi:hypothetical protein
LIFFDKTKNQVNILLEYSQKDHQGLDTPLDDGKQLAEKNRDTPLKE